jgi:hypothetical protein
VSGDFDFKQALQDAQRELIEDLRKMIREGTATAADRSCLRQFLKDNNVESLPVPGSPMASLLADLPFAGGGPPSH